MELSVRNRLLVLIFAALLALAGAWSLATAGIDAIPDLSENQVIVFAEWPGKSPREVEDLVASPLGAGLQGLAGVRTVRTEAQLGFAMADLIFEEGVGQAAARTRVLERLSSLAAKMPPGVVPALAPDANALGQVFWYTLEGDGYDPGELRTLQDTIVGRQLASVPGVSEVAAAGGFTRAYIVDVDTDRLAAYGIPLAQVVEAASRASGATGGGVLEANGAEYRIRGVAWARGADEIASAVVAVRGSASVAIRDVGRVSLGPEPRRSILERDGHEAVGGVVLIRPGANPRDVVAAVKEKIASLAGGLPAGVHVVPFYDRTKLVGRALGTLERTLVEEIAVASLVVFLVLGHLRSALVVCLALPFAVLTAFLFMRVFGVAANVMSLSGIAISVGVLVDAAIVLVENATTHLREAFGDEPVRGDTRELVLAACRTVGRPLFFAVAIVVVSFLPVFALSGIEGRLFRPLAFTKTFALLGTGVFAVTLVPSLLPSFLRGRLRTDDESWLVRSVKDVYRPVLAWLLPRPKLSLFFLVLLVSVALALAPRLGREFMPPLDEGSILEMPTSVPRVSLREAGDDLRARDAVLRSFPEVESVVGKAGRAETATDPAPPEMIETIIELAPREAWAARGVAPAFVARELARAHDLLWRKGLVHARDAWPDATVAALATFDACVRDELARRAADERPALERELVGAALVALAREDHPELVSELALRHGRWLRTVSPREEVAALVSSIVSFLAAAAAPDADEAATRALDARRLELARDAAARADALLALRAPGELAWSVLMTALESARAANAVAREPSETELAALREELERGIQGELVLTRKTKDELVREMDHALAVPGWGNIWTQPIVNRTDMLATGIRSIVGARILGPDLASVEKTARDVAAVLREVPGAHGVFVDQLTGASYLEVEPDRARLLALGIRPQDVNDAVEAALEGKVAGATVEGRARVPIRVRFGREPRAGAETLARALVTSSADEKVTVPLASVARIVTREGPSTIKGENGLLRCYVQLDVRDRDPVGFVEEAQRLVQERVHPAPGTSIEWGGEFESERHARDALIIIVPLVLVLVFVILQATFGDAGDAALMFLAVLGALAGGVIAQWLVSVRWSVAVWVGFIACFGLATETGIIMVIYLRQALARRGGLESLVSLEEVDDCVLEGAVQRLRPKLLTEAVIVLGLVPMLWASGTGAEVMRPMAVPVLGGILVADEVIDLAIPVFFAWLRRRRWAAARS